MAQETTSDDVPKLIIGWRRHEEAFENFKDKVKSKFEATGYVVKQKQSEDADRVFDDLKQREGNNQKEPPYSHLAITFKTKPGWRVDAYQFGMPGIQTYFVCRTFRPDGRIYYTWIMRGLEWDEWLGYLDHHAYLKEREERGISCTCVDCDRVGNDGASVSVEWRST